MPLAAPVTMRRLALQFEHDHLQSDMAEALKEGLHALSDLKLVPHNDPNVLRLKRHLREAIAELEDGEAAGD